MKVSELISFLKTQPQDLTVVYKWFGEQRELDSKHMYIKEYCEPRPDKIQSYLVLPGN